MALIIGSVTRNRTVVTEPLLEGTHNLEVKIWERFNKGSVYSVKDTDLSTFDVETCCGADAGFTSSGTTICEGTTINLTNSSTGALGYNWFLDGVNFSQATDTSYTFSTAGTYELKLQALDTACYDSMVETITVYAEPVAAGFMYTNSNINYDFTDTNSMNDVSTSWWSFGDGATDSGMNVSHTYATTDSFMVCLTVSNMCGLDTICEWIEVTCPLPTADYAFDINGMKVNFYDSSSSANTWWWTFGDGGFSSIQHPTYTYASPGTYNVCLVITDECGADTLCEDVVIEASGIDPVHLPQLLVYPNPITDLAFIPIGKYDDVVLSDLTGRNLEITGHVEKVSNGLLFAKRNLSSGTYILKIKSELWRVAIIQIQ
jgi:PKD repeat protein